MEEPMAGDHSNDEEKSADLATAREEASVNSVSNYSGVKHVNEVLSFVKIAIVGDPLVGKSSLMLRFVEDAFNTIYTETVGISVLKRKILLSDREILLSLGELGGQDQYQERIGELCSEAVACLFLFDLTRTSSLTSIKELYRKVIAANTQLHPFLVGTKFDNFVLLPDEDKVSISTAAIKLSRSMSGTLIYTSSSDTINIHKLFKLVLAKVFDLRSDIKEVPLNTNFEPLCLYK